MLKFIHARDLDRHPRLAHGMFADRALQFRDRRGWPVEVDANGEERDAYDACDPLYVVYCDARGDHLGSFRLLPTEGPTMANDVFGDLMGAGGLRSPHIWECTRFCLAERAPLGVAGALMLGGGDVMRHYGVTRYLGVFDRPMIRIYRRIGAEPEVLGWQGEGRDRIGAGLWSLTGRNRARVAGRAGVPGHRAALWFRASLGAFPGAGGSAAATAAGASRPSGPVSAGQPAALPGHAAAEATDHAAGVPPRQRRTARAA